MINSKQKAKEPTRASWPRWSRSCTTSFEDFKSQRESCGRWPCWQLIEMNTNLSRTRHSCHSKNSNSNAIRLLDYLIALKALSPPEWPKDRWPPPPDFQKNNLVEKQEVRVLRRLSQLQSMATKDLVNDTYLKVAKCSITFINIISSSTNIIISSINNIMYGFQMREAVIVFATENKYGAQVYQNPNAITGNDNSNGSTKISRWKLHRGTLRGSR